MSLRTKIRELRLRDRLSQEELAQRVACGGRPSATWKMDTTTPP